MSAVEPIAIKIVNGKEVKVYPYIPPPDSRFVTWPRRRSGTHPHQNVYRGLGEPMDSCSYYEYVSSKADNNG